MVRLAQAFIGLILLAGLIQWLGNYEPGEIGLLSCFSRVATGIPCPGCGMTRACMAFSIGRWQEAWNFHPLAFPLILSAVVFAIAPNRVTQTWRRLPKAVRVGVSVISIGVIFVLYFIRLSNGSIP